MSSRFTRSSSVWLALAPLTLVSACALQRAPIVERAVDRGGGLDAPVELPDVPEGGDDVPMQLPDVPLEPDAPSDVCDPPCAPGQVCTDRSCLCAAEPCGEVGGECRDTTTCEPCGSLEASCCTTREPCGGGAVCGMSGRCEIVSECGGLDLSLIHI